MLAAGAAAAAVTGAVLLRTWDRKAGKRVAELTRARARDEWRTEERVAELETDVEESREIRAGLDAKLRAKRAELARLRSEHAALLRRYATAETERASALEGRRLLAIEAGQPPAGGALVPARREPGPAADATPPPPGALTARPRPGRPPRSPRRTAPCASCPATPPGSAPPARTAPAPSRSPGPTTREARGGRCPGVGGPELRPVPAAAAIAPPRPSVSRTLGGFDFFGNATVPHDQPTAPWRRTWRTSSATRRSPSSRRAQARVPARAALPQAADEAAAAPEKSADAGTDGAHQATDGATADGETTHGAGEVIDLTAHDETEQLDLAELRSAIS
ncbi:hypothetical protein O1L55_07525 [Streptomyces albulus]|nr:hypothetical protein [Streptomyces noursei]